MIVILAVLIGVVTGLRAMTGLAAAAWAAHLGFLDLSGSFLGWLASIWTVGIATLLAVVELISDQLPATPSRKVPIQFGTRVLVGALAGAAIGIPASQLVPGAIAGAVGAVIGTLGGAAIRGRLARAFGADRPAALIEDVVAILGAVAIVCAL